ncbi:hypothetical protein GJAV_G00060200 [Gymnothorax javanicus]|nr:hypothetical protein GJAV_G00060200 [Gymnothorax javanicus]
MPSSQLILLLPVGTRHRPCELGKTAAARCSSGNLPTCTAGCSQQESRGLVLYILCRHRSSGFRQLKARRRPEPAAGEGNAAEVQQVARGQPGAIELGGLAGGDRQALVQAAHVQAPPAPHPQQERQGARQQAGPPRD